MTRSTSRSAVLLVTLVALLAGTAGAVVASVGTAVAGPAASLVDGGGGKDRGQGTKAPLGKKKVAKIAKKQALALVQGWAPTGAVGSAGNSSQLGGQPPGAYQTSAFTVALQPVTTAVGTQTWRLPSVPTGTYQVSVSLTATMSSNGVSLYCALFQDGVSADLVTAYGVAYNQATNASWRTVNATRMVPVSGQLLLQCRALPLATANKINAVPANENYAPAQVSFVKVDTATALGTAQSAN